MLAAAVKGNFFFLWFCQNLFRYLTDKNVFLTNNSFLRATSLIRSQVQSSCERLEETNVLITWQTKYFQSFIRTDQNRCFFKQNCVVLKKMVSNGQPHNPMLWAPRRFPPIMASPYFGYLPPGAPATYHSAPGAMSCGKFPNPKSVLPYLGNNKEAQMFLSRGAQVIIRMRGLPYNASPKEVVSL